ncbi:MAG: nucleoside permease [Planctomycetaceae bacterium]|nr:nucleoside permease [Planctomycetaceae bacterium]
MTPTALRLSVMMFLQFFVWGAWYVTVGAYMKEQGMSNAAVGNAYTVGPLAAIISPLFLGLIADRFFSTERVLGLLHIFGGVALLVAPSMVGKVGEDSWAFIGVLMVHMLCYMPTLGLTNTLAFHNIVDQEKEFPIIRVFGTIGWIVANLVVSQLLSADTKQTQFFVAGGSGILLGLYSFSLPHTPPPAKGTKVSIGSVLGLDAFVLMGRLSFAVFMISSFLICIPLAAYYAFAPIFVGDSGFEKIASTMSLGQMSEIFFMLIMPLCFRKLGVKWMLLIGMAAWVARYGLFAAAAPSSVTWMILIGIALHGICYDFFFVTGQIYVDKAAGPKIRGQAQGLLVLVTQGVGMLIGAQVSGRLSNAMITGEGPAKLEQWQQFWIVPCIAAGVIMVLFALLFHEKNGAESPVTIAPTDSHDPGDDIGRS